jgi:hypothetical protein
MNFNQRSRFLAHPADFSTYYATGAKRIQRERGTLYTRFGGSALPRWQFRLRLAPALRVESVLPGIGLSWRSSTAGRS